MMPNRQERGHAEGERGHPKIPSDPIKVLKKLKTYQPSDRITFRKELLAMLKSCCALYLLKNEQREWTGSTFGHQERRPTPATPFTPAPIRRTGAGSDTRYGRRNYGAPSGQREVYARNRPSMHAHARAYGQEHARAYGQEHAQAYEQDRSQAYGQTKRHT